MHQRSYINVLIAVKKVKFMSVNIKLDAALKYLERGFSVMPLGDNKKPLVEFKQYTHKPPSQEQVRRWWSKFPSANVGIITGKVSGLIVLDVDIKNGKDGSKSLGPMSPTACSKTATGGGCHYYLKHPGIHIANSVNKVGEGLDIRGEGGFVVAPPSNPGGKIYKWIVPLEDGLADVPAWLLKEIKTGQTKTKRWKKGLEGVSEGERNDTAISMAGKILHNLSPELHQIGWETFKTFTKTKFTPPMDEDEAMKTWESALKYQQEGKSKGRVNPAEIAVKLALADPNILLYTDQSKKAFIRFTIGDHTEHWPCTGKECYAWLRKIYWDETGKPITQDQVKTAVGTLESMAMFEGKSYELFVRTAFNDDGTLYYSLSNKEWEAVKVSGKGWVITKEYPILFRHYPTQIPQVNPAQTGDVWKIFDFINLKNDDEKIILLVWVIACFISDIPHPMIYLYGQQGAAKSTTSRLLKRIIDPCAIEIAEMQRNEMEFMQYLAHNHCVTFDNVSKISHHLSDRLCRVITGTGGSKRELFTDDSDIVYKVKKRICINGINRLKLRPDLAERTIIIELDRVDKKARRDEDDLFRSFEEALPVILGGIFDAIAGAISIRQTVKLENSPRMADFAKWGYAISESIGYGGEKFIDTYFKQLGIQISQSINDDFVCSFIVEYMTTNNLSVWEINATDLMTLVKGSDDYDANQDDIPSAPNLLSGHLNITKTLLAEGGIDVTHIEGRHRKIIFRKNTNSTAPTASSSSVPEPETNPIDYDDF